MSEDEPIPRRRSAEAGERSGLRQRIERSLAEAESRLLDEEALRATLNRLVEDDALPAHLATQVRASIDGQLDASRYVLKHLGAHLAIGVVFAFDMFPLPLGTIARVSWVAGSRVVETLRRNRARAKVHSVGVLVIAAVPWVGYAAYLLPLRRRSGELAFVLANHMWLERTGRTYERFLSDAPSPLRSLGRWLVPFPTASEVDDTASPGPC